MNCYLCGQPHDSKAGSKCTCCDKAKAPGARPSASDLLAALINRTPMPVSSVRSGHRHAGVQARPHSEFVGHTMPARGSPLDGGVACGSAAAETDTHSIPTPYPGVDELHGSATPPQEVVSGISSITSGLPDVPTTLPKHVPGYAVERILGHGGMGTVYLARQLSLDRLVALKVMSKVWASDPVFVARFVREAYAAALLNHPNVVQIYDIGEVDGTRYFSMEYVEGRTLSEMLKSGGRLDPETAVDYILQAARGLRHAHDRGVIHRDIKPDNLLVDRNGVVKVADLGLVKTPDMSAYQDRLAEESATVECGLHTLPPDMTGVRMALGTPAYMAPEQCRDAATVDHRVDIYSLGCTLYAMVTGRQPFVANDSVELMKKHAYEPPVPPESYTPRLSRELSAIILRMMAKLPGDRYRHIGELILTLEEWLGQTESKASRYSPREDQIAEVEQLARQFRSAPTAQTREHAVSGFLTASALFALLLTVFGKTNWAFGVAGLVVQSATVYFVLNGWSRKTFLFTRVRLFISGMSRGDWLVAASGAGLFLAFLWLSNLLWVWAGFGLLGSAAAFVLWYVLDRKLAAERHATIQAADQFVSRLRRQGVADDDSRFIVAKYSGPYWEEFFEGIFGYEAKLNTRAVLLRGGAAGKREKFAAWREPIINLLNYIETLRKRSRDRALLERSEYQRLLAAGFTRRAARERAAKAAAELLEHGDVIRELITDGPSPGLEVAVAQNFSGSFSSFELESKQNWLMKFTDWLVGPTLRAVAAAILIAACGWWVFQNGILRFGGISAGVETMPLVIEGIPPGWTDWCDTANVGWGGMLLLGSLFYRGGRMAALSLLGAGVVVLGHKFGIRTVEPVRDYHVALFVGTVLTLIGYRLGQR